MPGPAVGIIGTGDRDPTHARSARFESEYAGVPIDGENTRLLEDGDR